MKRLELVEFNKELLKKMQNAGVKIDDWKYIPMVKDYLKMVESGEKRTFAAMKVSDKYKVHPKTVYNVLKRLCSDCNSVASE